MKIHLYELTAEIKHELYKTALGKTLKKKFPDADYDLDDVFDDFMAEFFRGDLDTWEEFPWRLLDTETITKLKEATSLGIDFD